MPKFLHTADWQIGRQFSTFVDEDAHPLAEARLQAVSKLAALATEHQVDAVLVAGDVFDLQTVSDRTIRRMFNAMSGFAGPWVLISGNHDAALAESVWTRAQRLGAVPANVVLALQAQPVLLDQARMAILPAPLTQRHTYGDATAWFDLADTPEGYVRVGLAHGSVQGILAEDIDSANPIGQDRATRARLDYLALGDWHGCKRIDDRTWYSGTPEPDRFKGNDAGRALLVDIAGPGAMPVVTALDTAQFQWQQLAANLQVSTDLDQLISELALQNAQSVVDLTVQGQVTLDAHQRLHEALGQTAARVRHLRTDLSALHLVPTDEDIASLQADGYPADILADLREEQNLPGEPGIAARDALALLSSALIQRAPALAAGGAA